jgi:hypothetical protein
MDFIILIVPIVGFLVFLASLFSTKKGVTTTIISILIPVGAVFGLAISPNPETLFIILIAASVLIYGGGRYWRNIEGFIQKRG